MMLAVTNPFTTMVVWILSNFASAVAKKPKVMIVLVVVCLLNCSQMVIAEKPNVLIILADDVGTGDVPGYWKSGKKVDTPNLEDLVANGVVFTDAHSTPVCASSRYVLLSGNYQHRGTLPTGTWTLNYDRGNQFLPGQKSIANVFRNNGYHTSMYGKWHLGLVPTHSNFKPHTIEYSQQRLFTRAFALSKSGHNWNEALKQGPWDVGFDKSYITTGGIQAPPYAFLRDGKFQLKDLRNVTHWDEGSYRTKSGYSEILFSGDGASGWDSSEYNMILVNETKEFIQNHVQERPDDPFFTYVALGSVHIPHTPPFKYLDGTPIAGQYPSKHMDVLSEVDKVVGSLVEVLEDQKLLNNTIILFGSDNGGLNKSSKYGHRSNGYLRGQKGSIFEGGHRVPLILRWDKGAIPRGEKRSYLLGLNDIFATLCDLAGIEVPIGQAVDSASFASRLIKNQPNGSRKYLGTWRYANSQHTHSSLRKGSMKLVYNHKTNATALFNLTWDTSERYNIAKKNPYLVREMKDHLRRIGPCYDKSGWFKGRFISCKWYKEHKDECKKNYGATIRCGKTCAIRTVDCSATIE